jgi:hypothetical protein
MKFILHAEMRRKPEKKAFFDKIIEKFDKVEKTGSRTQWVWDPHWVRGSWVPDPWGPKKVGPFRALPKT